MVAYRTVLAGLIALAVAVAPVSSALAAQRKVVETPKAAAADCHSQKATPACPECDSKASNDAKCPGDGSKCCKLTGTVTALVTIDAPTLVAHDAADPEMPAGWQLRPRPPPPRT